MLILDGLKEGGRGVVSVHTKDIFAEDMCWKQKLRVCNFVSYQTDLEGVSTHKL